MLDLVEEAGDVAMLGLEPIDHRPDLGVRVAKSREQQGVLGVVVAPRTAPSPDPSPADR